MKTYEAVFIFHRSENEAASQRIEAIRAEIEKLGGGVSNVKQMGKNAFARPLRKRDAGVYVLVVFSMEPDKVGPLVKLWRRDENILRVHVNAGAHPAPDANESGPGPEPVTPQGDARAGGGT